MINQHQLQKTFYMENMMLAHHNKKYNYLSPPSKTTPEFVQEKDITVSLYTGQKFMPSIQNVGKACCGKYIILGQR